MALFRSANRYMTFKRQTAYVLDSATAAASMTADRQPVSGGLLSISVSGGTSNTGDVTITGLVDSVSDSETVTFTKARKKNTNKIFTSITGITTTGLADEATIPKIYIQAIGTDGSPQLIPYTIAESRPVTTSYMQMKGAANWPAETYGTFEGDWMQIVVSYEEVWQPRVGDLVYDDSHATHVWLVRAVRPFEIGHALIPTFYEVRATRFST